MPRKTTRGFVEAAVTALKQQDKMSEVESILSLLAPEGIEERQKCCVFKYGLNKCLEYSKTIACIPHYLPKTVMDAHLAGVPKDILAAFPAPAVQHEDSLEVICPPTGTCLVCDKNLKVSNKSTSVTYYTTSGTVLQKTKVTLRCGPCKLNYGYAQYGNNENGYQFYPLRRRAVEANDTHYFSRDLMHLQFSFSQHCWVSFEGFTEAWKDAFTLTRKQIFDRRVLADSFWWYNLEEELRAKKMTFHFKGKGDRERCMKLIDTVRQSSLYPHPEEECLPECKARGCGVLWVTDGIWKTQFAHCMWNMEVKCATLPLANLPSVCTNETLPGKAFCQAHCELISQKNIDIPTGLKEFKSFTNIDEEEELVSPDMDQTGHTYASSMPRNCLDDQGAQGLLNDFPEAVQPLSQLVNAPSATKCSKDKGDRDTLRRMSRGHQFIVRAGGHIDTWSPLYQSESVGQVFIILISWLYMLVKDLPQSSWNRLWLAYDNMCQLVKCKASRDRLPLSSPYDVMWARLNKIVDGLHIKNHVDPVCLTQLHPDNIYKQHPELKGSRNTQAGEQTFVWLGRFKKIIASMPKTHHLFYVHRMVQARNEYNTRCYREVENPCSHPYETSIPSKLQPDGHSCISRHLGNR